MISHIQHKAKYNNYVIELMKCLDEHMSDLGIYPRLLAMETDYKEWVAAELAKPETKHRPFITEDMLKLATDAQVQMLMELKQEVWDLLTELDRYWQDTQELKAEFN